MGKHMRMNNYQIGKRKSLRRACRLVPTLFVISDYLRRYISPKEYFEYVFAVIMHKLPPEQQVYCAGPTASSCQVSKMTFQPLQFDFM